MFEFKYQIRHEKLLLALTNYSDLMINEKEN